MKLYVSMFASALLMLSLQAYAGQDIAQSLFDAISAGDLARVGALLDGGASVNDVYRGVASLAFAVEARDSSVVQLLLERGADINGGEGGMPPLHMALEVGDEALTRLLLARGADPEKRYCNQTALTFVVSEQRDVALARLLLEHGACANEYEYGGETLLHSAVRAKASALVQMLLKGGAKVDVRSDRGILPLLLAVAAREEAIVQLLLEHGASVDEEFPNFGTPLEVAYDCFNLAIVQLLLEHGAKSGVVGLLSRALRDNRKKAVRLLIGPAVDQGISASLNLYQRGQLAQYFEQKNDAKMLSLFLSLGAITNQCGLKGLLRHKLEQGHHNSCCALVDHGVGLSRLSRQQRQRWNGELVRRYNRRISTVADCLNEACIPADVGHIVAHLSGQSKNQMRRIYKLMQ